MHLEADGGDSSGCGGGDGDGDGGGDGGGDSSGSGCDGDGGGGDGDGDGATSANLISAEPCAGPGTGSTHQEKAIDWNSLGSVS